VFADWQLGRIVAYTLKQSDEEGRSQTLAWVVMPDHVHWLMELGQGVDLSATVGWMKGLSARRVRLATENVGSPLWQTGFHDHALRKEDDLPGIARYVVANPLRKKLVERIGDYPLWDAVWL